MSKMAWESAKKEMGDDDKMRRMYYINLQLCQGIPEYIDMLGEYVELAIYLRKEYR